MKPPFRSVILALLAAATIPGSATAATVFTGGIEVAPGFSFSGSFTHGVDFTSTTAQQLTALGFWDSGANGLAISYTVGLWQTDTQTLLASATISNASPLDTSLTVEGGQWRYETLGAPVNLVSGTTYTMGFYDPSGVSEIDTLFLNYPTVTTGSTVTIINQRRFLSSAGLAFPSGISSPANSLYTGQLNAQFALVPEPGMASLVALGALGLLGRRRNNHQ